jgi:hypothetical protein
MNFYRESRSSLNSLGKMARDFFDSRPDEQNIVLVDAAPAEKAIRLVKSCEQYNPADAEILFDHLLDRVTCSNPSVTDYVLAGPAQCPGAKTIITLWGAVTTSKGCQCLPEHSSPPSTCTD